MSTENKLPEWLQTELPEPRPVKTISWADGVFHVTDHPETYTSIIEAYDAVEKTDEATTFDESVNGHGGQLHHRAFFCDQEKGEKSARLLIAFTDEDHLDILQTVYNNWMELHEQYKQNQQNWVTAYNWLQHHPVFWHRLKNEKTYYWVTDDGLKSNSVFAGYNEETGKPQVLMEHGGHVEPEYTTFYHDLKLDTEAETFEEAYINLASLVNKFYNPDGTEKPDVPYEKSYLEKQLDKYAEELETKNT